MDRVIQNDTSKSNSTTVEDLNEYYNDYLYLEHNFGLMILTALILGSTAIVGTLGNFLIIFAVCYVKTLRTTGNLFVVNLALADMIITTLVDPLNTVGVVAGRSVLMHNWTLCNWIASFCAPACLSSMWNMCAISLNRYVLICKPHLYSTVFTFPKTILMCIGIWILVHILHAPNHFGWGHSVFNPDYYLCSFDVRYHSYALFYVATGVIIPLVGVLYGYARIFQHVRNVKVQLRQHQHAKFIAGHQKEAVEIRTNESAKRRTKQKSGINQEDIKLAKTLFAAFVVFLICWFPFAVLIAGNQPRTIPGWVYTVIIIMAHGNSAVNPILYGCANEKFRAGYRLVLRLNRQVIPEASKAGPRTIEITEGPANK